MRIFLYTWFIIVGGWLIYLGWPPREPICIVCTPTITLLLGIVTVIIGVVAAVRNPAVRTGPNAVAAR